MAIQILGGMFKGRKLKVPPESITRPTSVVLRRKIFDANQNMQHVLFIDLCAGSGAMGLEALSRGAEKVIFVESNVKASNVLQNNVSTLAENSDSTRVEIKKAMTWLKHYEFSKESETILFFDPPYEDHNIYSEFLDFVKKLDKDLNLRIWVESEVQKGVVQSFWSDNNLKLQKIYSQGHNYIAVLIP